jgi:NAD(P)-dependent dehydrogenase (short-subunit alcohol dehydrogenase family)
LTQNSVAVVTGGAAGIGLAAAMKFARLGLRVSWISVKSGSPAPRLCFPGRH